MPPSVVTGADGVARCWWGAGDPDSLVYHDDEWGRPTADDNRLFEMLCLEGFQAGLSWLTILRKRPRFREVFSRFDIDTVAGYGSADVDRLVGDAGIIRHRGKIVSAVNNARRAADLRHEFGSLGAFLWRYQPTDERAESSPIPSQTAESRAMSRDLKRRGWTFVGPTTVYAFMQSVGMVNDHVAGCGLRMPVEFARGAFVRPPGTII